MSLWKKKYSLLFLLTAFLFFPLINASVEAAQIRATDFQVFQEGGKTRGRVTLSGDCLGGIPENDYISVNAYLVKPGGAPPLLKTYYLSYYCPSGFSYGQGNCLSNEQLHGYLCDSVTLWSVVHRSNRPWMDAACGSYLCEETAAFNYVAEFDMPDSLLSACGGRTIIAAQLDHTWGGPNANWSAAIHLFSSFYDNGGLYDSIGDVFAEVDYSCKNVLCKLSNLSVAKDITFAQNVSYDGGLSSEKKPFAGLRVKVNCGNGFEYRKTGNDGILHLNVGPCGCSVTVCDPRVIDEYMYQVTAESNNLYHLIPNDEENAKGYERFAATKYFEAINAVDGPTKLAVDLLTPIQKFKQGMDFHHYYLDAARKIRKKLLAKSSDCGKADYGIAETDQEKHLNQARQIIASVNTSHKRSAIGPQVEKDPASKPEDDFLTVLAHDDDVLVTTMQDLVRVKLKNAQLDIHSTALLVAGEDGSYNVNVLNGFVVVYNADGVAFSPALGPGSYGRISPAGNLEEVKFGLSSLPDYDRTMKVVTEDGNENLNGIDDVTRLFNAYRKTVAVGEGQFTYRDLGGLDLAGEASAMRPVSFTYGYDDKIQVELATPLFAQAVDLYLGVYAEPYDKMLTLNRFGRWTSELTPWKKSVTVVPFAMVLPSFSALGLVPGDYKAYLYAVPAGSNDFSTLTGWESVLSIPPETTATATVDSSIAWHSGDPIALVTDDNISPPATKKYSAAEISLKDAHVYAYPYRNWNNANWGGSTQLQVSSQIDGLADTESRIFMKFDLTALPQNPASIDKAELMLDVFDGSGEFGETRLKIFRVLENWGEGDHVYHPGEVEPDAAPNTVSWTNQPNVDLQTVWSSVNIRKGDGPFSIIFDITNLLKSWLDGSNNNYGVMIKGLEDSSYRFYFPSSERETDGTGFSKPSLVIHTSSASSRLRTVTLSSPKDATSIDKCSYSFVNDDFESNPNLENYDILVESWCVDKLPLCGNFADLGVVDIDSVNSYPASGYIEDCTDSWDATHTFVSRNRDGSHTVFKITRHVKLNNCQHVVDISYRNLD